MDSSTGNGNDPNHHVSWEQASTSGQEDYNGHGAANSTVQHDTSYSRHVATSTPSGHGDYRAHSSTASSSEAYSTEPGPSSMQAYAHPQYTEHQYPQGVRVQFATSYSQAQQSTPQDMYRPTQSYERISPVEEYRDVSTTGNDAMPTYTIQAADGSSQLITASTIDTSGLHQQGYPVHHLMAVDADNRVVSVQRIISPDERTVSQSSMVVRREIPDGSQPPLIAVQMPSHSQQNFSSMQPSQSTSMPKALSMIVSSSQAPSHSNLVAYPSTSEVSTTAGSPGGWHHATADQPMGETGESSDQAVSSISAVLHGTGIIEVVRTPPKRHHRHESVSGEPDTTQGDGDDFPQHHQVHHRAHLVEETDETGLLHSTVVGSTVTTAEDVGMDMSLDTSHLSQGSVESSGMTSSSDSAMDSGLDRTVDSSVGHHHHHRHQLSPPPYDTHHIAPSGHVTPPGHVASSGLLMATPDHVTQGTLNLSTSNQIAMSTMALSGYTMANLQYAVPPPMDPQPSGSSHMGYFIPVDLQAAQIMVTNGHMNSVEDNKENFPDSRGRVNVRKSDRIAHMEADMYPRRLPKYIAKVYNVFDEIWCEECMTTYSGECPSHKLQTVPDKMVLSRAWSSLPGILQIFRFGNTPELGVFAKRNIPKQTQFGPFVGELVGTQEEVMNKRFLLRLEKDNGEQRYFNTADENHCNWMMFVRPAENYIEQNLVAYQFGYDIFFTVTKNIEPKQELKVWYAAHYAERLGVKTHAVSEEEIEAMGDPDWRWQCYECGRRFKTSALLQNHLIEHEEGGAVPGEDEEYSGQSGDHATQGGQPGLARKRGRPPKIVMENKEQKFQSWKKRTTNLYLNKTLKKYKKRHDPEVIKRTIKSLYKRKGKETGGNEWVCTHCDLTFDNSSLLNLHTLTHAAEDVGMAETEKVVSISTGADGQLIILDNTNFLRGSGEPDTLTAGEVVSLHSAPPACPVCHKEFESKRDLIEHASEHAMSRKKFERPNKCSFCWKAFTSHDRLQKHMLCHGDEDSKPLQCGVCFKRFMNNSALSCHMKTHSDKKYYECPICRLGFDQSMVLKDHVKLHQVNGLYVCPVCQKQFDDYLAIKKHIRGFHSDKKYPCPSCDKIFPRPDKLKLHMLRHSAHRDFMCETCGRQFKRKDKLKEHMKRMHSLEREKRIREKAERPPSMKKFIPKVSPTDYHRFIYKCHSCLLGFKRRGMLVNHLAKRHPDIKPDQVPELNLPILKTQRDYYCQYCDKIYKSSSKRKAHIIKNHPGADLPLSSRKKALVPEIPGLPNPTYSQTVGSITTMPHSCDFCHKQYASKAKLMQHQRKKHSELVPPAPERRLRDQEGDEDEVLEEQDVKHHEIHVYENVQAAALTHAQPDLQAADLLTQAMSELTQSLSEYRTPTAEYHMPARLATHATLVQAATHIPIQHSTIELSHLGQALGQTNYTTGHLTIQASAASPGQPQPPTAVPVSIQTIPTHTITMQPQPISAQTIAVTSGTTVQHVQVPVSSINGVPGHTYIQRTWSYPNYR